MTWTLERMAQWEMRGKTGAGLPIAVHIDPAPELASHTDRAGIGLRLEYERLKLLRGYDELLCLEGLTGVDHLPHQIETVRRVLRHFRSRALLADEVGLGKTIEACLLIREYLLRGLARRVLILAPAPLVSQWREELQTKFHLDFAVPDRHGADFDAGWWARNDLVLSSIAFAKARRQFADVTAASWDLVVVDEAHHCKNRATQNWKLIDALKRRALFMLTATPVQNNLIELYNLLTLLEPGHLKTEADFKRRYVRRGNPRDPLNREQLRGLLREVMIRNTRGLVQMDLPPRYAQTLVVQPDGDERLLYAELDDYLRRHAGRLTTDRNTDEPDDEISNGDGGPAEAGLSRMQFQFLLLASGSHPAAVEARLQKIGAADREADRLLKLARRVQASAKEHKLLELLRRSGHDKTLVFASFQATLDRLAKALETADIPFAVYTGRETSAKKDAAVEAFREHAAVMLCSESGGEGRNLQFANTLVNFDLPWNPMRIEQRVGRIHRIGQQREVFVFNLCAAGSIEERILRLLGDKIRMFELVVGEIGSILGNLEGGEEFESLILNLWLRSRDADELDAGFDRLGEELLDAQDQYVRAKELDAALFGEDYE